MAPRPRRRPLSRLGRAQSCPDARRRAEGALRGNSETSFFFKKKGEREEKQKTKKRKEKGGGGETTLMFPLFFPPFFPFCFSFFLFFFFSFHFSFCEPLFLNSASPFFLKNKNNKQDKEKQWPEGFLLHAEKIPIIFEKIFPACRKILEKNKNNKQNKEKQWPEGFLLHAKKSPLYLKRFFLHAGKF